jgi:2-keto-4-pentenoate hydratase/2-oxohepta-3-ene-1,7-dioic acid hydratase in catechol pathway
MKIVRYENAKGEVGYAEQKPDGSYARIAGDVFGRFAVRDERVDIARLLAPVVPPAIFCIGLNYRHHAQESGMQVPERPVVFLKSANALQDPGAAIVIPGGAASTEIDYECELVIVIARKCKNVSKESALDYVLGYTCGNDVSSRDWQLRMGGSQWCRGKSFDTFAPIGPCVVTKDAIPDPNALRIQTLLNGEVMQDSNTSDMVFNCAALVAFLSQSTTLLPGTVIFTGTPQGIGMARKPPRWLVPGDEVKVVIDAIGTLTNRVENEKN